MTVPGQWLVRLQERFCQEWDRQEREDSTAEQELLTTPGMEGELLATSRLELELELELELMLELELKLRLGLVPILARLDNTNRRHSILTSYLSMLLFVQLAVELLQHDYYCISMLTYISQHAHFYPSLLTSFTSCSLTSQHTHIYHVLLAS